MPSLAKKIPLLLFTLGFFTCTWDTLLTHEVAGFTLKLYQPLFLLCFLSVFWAQRQQGLEAFLKPLNRPFALCVLLLAAYNMGLAPWSAFPLKSFLYSAWLIFQLLAIWLSAQHLASSHPSLDFYRIAWFTMLFLSAVVLVDQVAYRFGYIGGLLGGNQDAILHWGMSRPHAFASEPSYLASFFCLGLVTCTHQIFHSARSKFFFWAGLLLILFADIATTSRTGWLSLGLGFGCITLLPLLAGRRIQLKPLAAALGLLAAVLALFFLFTPPEQREVMKRSLVDQIALGRDGSGNSRLNAHLLAFKMAKETNWLGTGMGASYRYYLLHGGVDNTVPGGVLEKHYGSEVIMSIWGQLLAEGGPMAVALFGLAGIFLLRDMFRKWRGSEAGFLQGSIAALFVFFFFIAFLVGNVCRGDVWVWFALWSVFSLPATANFRAQTAE